MKKYQTAAIDLGQEKLTYVLRPHKRANRFKLTVYVDRGLVVTVPRRGYNQQSLQAFIKEHSEWVLGKLASFQRLREGMGNVDREKEYRERREEAKQLVTEKIKYFSEKHNIPIRRITIKNQRTRWGSCSGRGNLNFNYRVVLLPPHLVDYVIFHELCHLKEFNHSVHFWNLVAKEIPNWRAVREELKTHNLSFY